MPETDAPGYQVLARKYRPARFADLIGQAAMVRTLQNAFAADRIAQAFILTGIRGTGKTTTARIIAKGLNCTAADGPTTEPCGECDACRAIAEGRHVDVMEMDAASNTGVGDVREIIDAVAYRAASARYKVYIIDEVHMLSASAFNALLKTLEEPPAHVKFVFATTEIRKVPVTVLSRCQRFDLRRVEPEVMIAHLSAIAAREGAEIDERALGLVARAAEGSVRDAVSLMDQAIGQGAGPVTREDVQAMLGLADRGRVLDLFDLVMKGDAAGALAELSAQYADGADPMAVLRDLAEVTHWLSVVRVTPDAAEDPTVAPEERARGAATAGALSMRALARMWQMLLTALEEVAQAPNAMMAAEMAIIRLTHVAELPAPEELVRRLSDAPLPPAGGPGADIPAPAGPPGPAAASPPTAPATPGGPQAVQGGAAPAMQDAPHALARYARFDQVVDLIRANRDLQLLVEVETTLRLVAYAPGRIEFEPTGGAAPDLAARLGQRLQAWTGARWAISVAGGGAATIEEARRAAQDAAEAEARGHPLVQAVFRAFPSARITGIRTADQREADAAAEALPEAPDDHDEDWDPFEDD